MGRQPRVTDLVPVDATTSWQAQMRQSLQQSIGVDDVKDIVEALKKRAKKGNIAAAKALLDLCGASGKAPATVYNVQVNCDAPPADVPTDANPGTRAKVEALRARAANGRALFHDHDRSPDDN